DGAMRHVLCTLVRSKDVGGGKITRWRASFVRVMSVKGSGASTNGGEGIGVLSMFARRGGVKGRLELMGIVQSISCVLLWDVRGTGLSAGIVSSKGAKTVSSPSSL